MSETIFAMYDDNQRIIRIIFYSILVMILGLFASNLLGINLSENFGLVFLIIIGSFLLVGLARFYVSDKRMEQEITSFHGRKFLSNFYKIYFPVIIFSLIVQVILSIAYNENIIDQSVSPTGFIVLIISGLLVGIGVIALSDYEMRDKSLKYAPPTKNYSIPKGIGYSLPLIGLFLGVTFFVRFIMEQTLGIRALSPSQSSAYEIDSSILRAARLWDFLTDTEQILILVSFIVVYIALEILLRGFIANEVRGYGLGPAGMVFIPAIIQATAFTNGEFAFSDTWYYFYKLFEGFFLGLVLGLILWRTGRFIVVIISALFIRLFEQGNEFRNVILKLLPDQFGEYNPLDSTQSLADLMGLYLIYIQIALIVTSPFILIVAYEEVGNILKKLYPGIQKQWFGYLTIGVGFFIIDLVFSFIFGLGGGFFILSFIIAIIVIGFVLNILFKVLPDPEEPPALHTEQQLIKGEMPLNVTKDIKFLESTKSWYEYPKRIGILGGFAFLYFLFLSASYRQLNLLEGLEIVKFIIFLVILPTILIGVSSFLISRAITKGFFFSESWRKSLLYVLLILFVINVLIWTSATATVFFQWRNVPFVLGFALLLYPKPIENPDRDFAHGLAGSGRYATFKWVEHYPDTFDDVFDAIKDIPSENVQSGVYIIAARLRRVKEWELMELLREDDLPLGISVGAIFALGIIKGESAEGLLLELLDHEDVDILKATYWALGRLGSTNALNKMAMTLEGNPKQELLNIAEDAILKIDPNYPIAGIRDSIMV